MILVIDNYDSFTYNLVQYIGEINSELKVVRNDKITLSEIDVLNPHRIVISPGPGTPNTAGISIAVVREFGVRLPILGICLGHQAIVEAYGGRVVRSQHVVHGKTSNIQRSDSPLFSGLPTEFRATRYHSLIAEEESLPDTLIVKARSDDGVIMAVEHKTNPVYGLQFHPESIATIHGKQIIKNFLEL